MPQDRARAAATDPFIVGLYASLPGNEVSVSKGFNDLIPPGYRFVIETVSGWAEALEGGQEVSFSIAGLLDGEQQAGSTAWNACVPAGTLGPEATCCSTLVQPATVSTRRGESSAHNLLCVSRRNGRSPLVAHVHLVGHLVRLDA